MKYQQKNAFIESFSPNNSKSKYFMEKIIHTKNVASIKNNGKFMVYIDPNRVTSS